MESALRLMPDLVGALRAPASTFTVFADARPLAWNARRSFAAVLADSRATACLTSVALAAVDTDLDRGARAVTRDEVRRAGVTL